jgi:hypothetical protein
MTPLVMEVKNKPFVSSLMMNPQVVHVKTHLHTITYCLKHKQLETLFLLENFPRSIHISVINILYLVLLDHDGIHSLFFGGF